jgi:hypothetical protein
MIDRGHDLPPGRQAEVLKLSRSSIYDAAQPVPPAELAIMPQIDELHLNYLFAGSRMLRDLRLSFLVPLERRFFVPATDDPGAMGLGGQGWPQATAQRRRRRP